MEKHEKCVIKLNSHITFKNQYFSMKITRNDLE